MLSLASVAFPAIPAGSSIVPSVLSVIANYSGSAVTMVESFPGTTKPMALGGVLAAGNVTPDRRALVRARQIAADRADQGPGSFAAGTTPGARSLSVAPDLVPAMDKARQ